MALRGARCLCTVLTRQCKPITLGLLKKLILQLRTGIVSPYVDILMQAALTTAFWDFFRFGELFPDHFSPVLHVTLSNVTLNSSSVIIHLKTLKTDIAKRGVDVRLFKNESFVQLRHGERSYSPFFLLPNDQSLTRKTFISNIRYLLTLLRIPAASYSLHSFRVGAATSAAAAGVSDHLIQTLGR